MEPEPGPGKSRHDGIFNTTLWHIVWLAKDGNSPDGDAALEELCRIYSPAVNVYLLRQGYTHADAQDLTQEFIRRFVHKEWLSRLVDRRSRFRAFLITFLKHFLNDHRRYTNADKRERGKVISLDACPPNCQEALAQDHSLTPDEAYDRRWAETVLQRALHQLRERYRRRKKLALFEHLKDLAPRKHGEESHASIAKALGMTTGAVKSAANTFRREYGKLLHREVAATVLDPRDVDAELNYLISLFAR